VWANDRAKAGALRGAAPVGVEDIHDLIDELTALAISQSKQQQSRAQAIAAGQAAGAQEAPHDDTAARVNNVSALSPSSELCSTAGCEKTVKGYFGFCKASNIQAVFLQCRECKLLVQSAQQYCPRALTHGCQGQPPFLPTPAADAARMSATVKPWRLPPRKDVTAAAPTRSTTAAATLKATWASTFSPSRPRPN
jgi:hypothetical protein